MVITGMLDESGTHRGATVSVMAGFVADARQCGNSKNAPADYLPASAWMCFTRSTFGALTKISRAGRLIVKSSFSMNFST